MNDDNKLSIDDNKIENDMISHIKKQDMTLNELQRKEEQLIDKLINIYKKKIEIKKMKYNSTENTDHNVKFSF